MKRTLKWFCIALSFFSLTSFVACNKKQSALEKEIESVRSEIARLEQILEEQGDTAEYYQTEESLRALYQQLIELEGKK